MPYSKRDGVNVYYESYGKGLPVVFLHPFSTNRTIWTFQLLAFARDHRCIVVDHRGHGVSDKPAAGYAITEMSKDVVAILDAAGVKSAVLVGNSIGGMIAMQTSLDAPDRVLGNLILSSATNFSANMPPELAEAMQKDWRGTFSGLVGNLISAKTKAERPEVVDFLEACFRVDENFTEQVFFASAGDPNGVFNWNISDRLQDIRQKTLVIAGEEDFGTTIELNKFLSDRIPNATLKVYKEIGHFGQLERPADFNNELRAFLENFV